MRYLKHVLCAHAVMIGSAFTCYAETFHVDTKTSRVYARVDAVRIGHNHGIEGKLKESQVNLGGAGELIIDMMTFSADTPVARSAVGLDGTVSGSDRKQTTENMHSADVLDVARYPRSVFEIRSITPPKGKSEGEAGHYTVSGTFTLHGTKRPLTFVAKIEPASGRSDGGLRMRGMFTVKQTDYGMTPYSALAGLAKVSNEVTIWGDIVLVPEAGPVASNQRNRAGR